MLLDDQSDRKRVKLQHESGAYAKVGSEQKLSELIKYPFNTLGPLFTNEYLMDIVQGYSDVHCFFVNRDVASDYVRCLCAGVLDSDTIKKIWTLHTSFDIIFTCEQANATHVVAAVLQNPRSARVVVTTVDDFVLVAVNVPDNILSIMLSECAFTPKQYLLLSTTAPRPLMLRIIQHADIITVANIIYMCQHARTSSMGDLQYCSLMDRNDPVIVDIGCGLEIEWPGFCAVIRRCINRIPSGFLCQLILDFTTWYFIKELMNPAGVASITHGECNAKSGSQLLTCILLYASMQILLADDDDDEITWHEVCGATFKGQCVYSEIPTVMVFHVQAVLDQFSITSFEINKPPSKNDDVSEESKTYQLKDDAIQKNCQIGNTDELLCIRTKPGIKIVGDTFERLALPPRVTFSVLANGVKSTLGASNCYRSNDLDEIGSVSSNGDDASLGGLLFDEEDSSDDSDW